MTKQLSNESSQHMRLIDVLSKTTKREEFELLVGGVITDEDRRLFGPQAKDLIINAILHPAAFPPAPATFSTTAYSAVIDNVVAVGGFDNMDRTVDPDRIDRLLTLSLENGVVEMEEDGRLSVPIEAHDILKSILMQYK